MTNRALAVLACLLPALMTLGCDRDDEPCAPEVPAGRISGHVRTAGLPAGATVSAVRIVDGLVSPTPLRTEPGADGFYSLDVPAGRYVVTLRLPLYRCGELGGTVSGLPAAVPDTLLIEASAPTATIDFDLASFTLELGVAPELDGESGRVVLHRRGADETTSSFCRVVDSAVIGDGRLWIMMAGIVPGDYEVEVVLGSREYLCFCPYDGEHLWLPGTRDRGGSTLYALAPDSLSEIRHAFSAEPARLSGRITGASQVLGLTNAADIALVTPDSTTVMGWRRILSADGSFSIPLHVPGPVRVVVRQDGVEQWAGGPGFAAATTYDLQSGQSLTGVDIVQSGLFVDVDGPGANLGTADIELYDASSLALVTTATVRIGSGRQFGVANLWPGRYVLRIAHGTGFVDGFISGSDSEWIWRPQWFDRTAAAAGAAVVEIPQAGDVVPLRVVLETGGAIEGRVEGPVGDTPYFYVYVTPADRPAAEARVFVSAAQGPAEFAIRGLADGFYKVGACPVLLAGDRDDPPPAGTAWYPGTTDWAEAGLVRIVDAGTVSELVLTLP